MEHIVWTWISLSFRLLRFILFFFFFIIFIFPCLTLSLSQSFSFCSTSIPVDLKFHIFIVCLVNLLINVCLCCIMCMYVCGCWCECVFEFIYLFILFLFFSLIPISGIRSTASIAWQTTRPWSGTPGWSWSQKRRRGWSMWCSVYVCIWRGLLTFLIFELNFFVRHIWHYFFLVYFEFDVWLFGLQKKSVYIYEEWQSKQR